MYGKQFKKTSLKAFTYVLISSDKPVMWQIGYIHKSGSFIREKGSYSMIILSASCYKLGSLLCVFSISN